MAKTKKRKASKAQLAALKRGRAKRKANAKKRTTKRRVSIKKKRSPTKKVVRKAVKSTVKTGGNTVAKKRRKSKSSTKRRVRRYASAARGFLKKSNAVEMMTNAGLAVVGGVTSGYLSSKLPITDARVRSAIPIVTGILIAGTLGQRNRMAQAVAQGMVVLGTVSLFKQIAPGVPMMAGEKVIMLPYSSGSSMGTKVRLGSSRRSAGMGTAVRLGRPGYQVA